MKTLYHRRNVGQALPLCLIILAISLALAISNIDRIQMLTEKIALQKNADAVALRMGTEYARSLNALVGLNQGIDEMVTQFQIYAGGGMGALIALGLATFVMPVAGAIAKKAAVEYMRGLVRLSRSMSAFGKELDRQIQDVRSQVFVNMCGEINKENILQLIAFVKQNVQLDASLLQQPLSVKQLKTFARIMQGLRHRFVTVHPNICDPAIAKKIDPFVRITDRENMTTCETHRFANRQALQALLHNQLLNQSITYAEATYRHEPVDLQTRKPLVTMVDYRYPNALYTKANALPMHIYTDDQGRYQDRQQQKHRFVFVTGQAEVCISVQDMYKKVKNNIRSFPIPEKITTVDFHNKSQFLLTVSKPYKSVKPFTDSRQLFSLEDQNLIRQTIYDIGNNLPVKLDSVIAMQNTLRYIFTRMPILHVQTQVKITGSYALRANVIDHQAQLTSIALAPPRSGVQRTAK